MKPEGISRTARRMSTKSSRRIKAQRQTKRALRMGRKIHTGTGPKSRTFRVRNTGTKREITVQAFNPEAAIALALSEHKLAKSAKPLIATEV